MSKPFPEIKTDRLLLREFQHKDAQYVQELAGDYDIADMSLDIPHPYPDGMAEKWILSHRPLFENGHYIVFAIEQSDTARLIGAMALVDINMRHETASVGYWIGKEFRNQGFATEALSAVVDYAFSDLKLNRVYASYFTRNSVSWRVLQKCGMKSEGCRREHFKHNGIYEDVAMCGILASEWKSNKLNIIKSVKYVMPNQNDTFCVQEK